MTTELKICVSDLYPDYEWCELSTDDDYVARIVGDIRIAGFFRGQYMVFVGESCVYVDRLVA